MGMCRNDGTGTIPNLFSVPKPPNPKNPSPSPSQTNPNTELSAMIGAVVVPSVPSYVKMCARSKDDASLAKTAAPRVRSVTNPKP